MSTKKKVVALLVLSVFLIIIGVGIGSVSISPLNVLKIIFRSLLPAHFYESIPETNQAIVMAIRLPRVLTAFLCGGVLAMTGVIMQSSLKNPLASAYTIGVSSGATLCAACTLFFATHPIIKYISLPLAGSFGAILSVLLVLYFSHVADNTFSDNSIILIGMTFSLFVSAILTILVSLNREKLGNLLFWQMGNFAWHGWNGLAVIAPISLLAFLFLRHYALEIDILTFGDEQAIALGVPAISVKRNMLLVSSAITGIVVSFVGIIGFVDLIAPHVIRKFFGSEHRIVLPLSFLFGGCLMCACDLIARTLLSPIELAVGAITAILGAPFFAYLYFFAPNKKKHIR